MGKEGGRGSEGRGEGIGGNGKGVEWTGGGRARWGRAGLLNFHLIVQKNWAEPGYPS